MLTASHFGNAGFGAASMSEEGMQLMMARLQVSEARIRSAYNAILKVAQQSGIVPTQAMIDGYNEMRDNYVAIAKPVVDAYIAKAKERGETVEGTLDIPPRFYVDGGTFGSISTDKAVSVARLTVGVPEVPGGRKSATEAKPLQVVAQAQVAAGLGQWQMVVLICGLALIATIFLLLRPDPEMVRQQNAAKSIEATTKTRQMAFSTFEITYANCMSQKGSDPTKCAASAAAAAEKIAGSGLVWQPPEHNWVYYVGLFVVVAGVGVGGYYAYKYYRKRKQGQTEIRVLPIVTPTPMLPAPATY